MQQQTPPVRKPPKVREDYVPADAYILPEYVRIEEETLWGNTWLIACREEEIPEPGDYHVFDIGKESILIVRQDDRSIKAFYNVCQHRGRRLKDNISGRTGKLIRCNFHGWRFNIDGSVESILNESDWDGCPAFKRGELDLKPVRLETWAGWVWVSMNPQIEALAEYLGPVVDEMGAYELEKSRFVSYQTIIVPCNWKIIVDAFNEAYHAPATHPWVFKYGAPMSTTKEWGIHGTFYQGNNFLAPHKGENVLIPATAKSMKEKLAYFNGKMLERGKSMVSQYMIQATERVAKEVPDGTDDLATMMAFAKFHREAYEADGLEWPKGITPEFQAKAATDWHIFPNTVIVPGVDSTLWHRMRPNGDDPSSSIWDIWVIERRPPEKIPPLNREFYASPTEFKGKNPFLEEDFGNMEACHKGMWSRGYHGGRTNPVQERSVMNFHKTLYEYYSGARPLKKGATPGV